MEINRPEQAKSAPQPAKWAGPPGDYFFVPGRDPGIWPVAKPEWLFRRVKGASVRQYARSQYANIQNRLERNLEARWTVSPVIFETNTFPIVAENVRFISGNAEVSGKWLLNGAAGDRAFTRYLKHNPSEEDIASTISFFKEAQASTNFELPNVRDTGFPKAVGIECRNLTNYYHFMTETLPLFSHYSAENAETRIDDLTVHCRNAQASEFSRAFIRAIYPEIYDRINFTDRPAFYDKVNIPFNVRHLSYSNGDARLTNLISETDSDPIWWRVDAHTQRRKIVLKNTYSTSLRLMRNRALSNVRHLQTNDSKKRIYVCRERDSSRVNQRELVGEELLWQSLEKIGFVKVFFEKLDPNEQISIMNQADVVVAQHGAFFANMMFAKSSAHIIEIGSLQTQFHRWGDFLGNAHVAECSYSVVFADMAQDDPTVVRSIKDGLIGVSVGQDAVDLIVDLAENGQRP